MWFFCALYIGLIVSFAVWQFIESIIEFFKAFRESED